MPPHRKRPRSSRETPPRHAGDGVAVDWARIEGILDRALDMPPDRWPRFLSRVCEGDPELRREVESLLSRRDLIEDFLEALPVEAGMDLGGGELDARAFEGRRIGPYRIVRELGRGGMGWVFLAHRADGLFERSVALKLVRPTLDDEDASRHFEAERRILARLDHPSIARLIDAGCTEEGRPYLVTEYVEGRTLDRHCREEGLGLFGRLELFRRVAEAVHHAHRHRMVHRDLKPSNVLVTADGRPKLLDFGIAEMLNPPGPAGERAPARFGPRWMTPGYAAPEQVAGDPATTATDVYQLGVLLYELLTGRRPFDGGGEETEAGSMLRADPPPPSRAAAGRLPERVRRRVEGDLDAIVLKALRAEPDDRYSSVRALLEDLDRHLDHRPVVARRATLGYRAVKFVRRHRMETAAASTVALALLVGSAVAVWQAQEAHRERDRAQEARARAELASAQARDVTESFLDLFRATDPWAGVVTNGPAARELLALGLGHVEGLEGQPPVQAGLLEVLARVHLRFGEVSEAEALVRRALELRGWMGAGSAGAHEEAGAHEGGGGPNDPGGVAHGLNTLALVFKEKGRYAEGEALHQEALALQVRHLGEHHPEVARTLSLMATRTATGSPTEAEARHRRALEIRRATYGSSHPLVAESLRALGRVHRIQGRPREAEAAFTEALEILRSRLGPEHPEVAGAMLNLADLLGAYGEDDPRPEALYRSALDIQRAAFGPDYPGLTHGMERLARILAGRGEHAAAEGLLRDGLDLRRRVFGPEHRAVAEGTGHLAAELHRRGRLAEAERLRRDEIALLERTLGPDHWGMAGALHGLAGVLLDRGRDDEARRLHERALEVRKEARGERHGAVALSYAALARLHLRRGERSEAERLYREALAILREERTEAHPEIRELRQELSELHAGRGLTEEARALRPPAGAH